MTTRILLRAESISVRKAIRKALPRERMELVPVSNAELAKYLLDLIHLGTGAKNAAVWSGKTVGRAFKRLGNGLKKAIRG